MSFSSDNPQIKSQVPATIDIPNVKDENFNDYLEGLLKSISDTVNGKEAGQYFLDERGSGQYYPKNAEANPRNIYRKTFDFAKLNGGSINAGETVQYAHEITNLKESAGIYAHCTSVDGTIFTATFPDICLNASSIIFTNPHTQALNQCDVVANILKE